MNSRPYYVCDTECYIDYWSIGFTNVLDPSVYYEFEMYPGHPLDIAGITWVMQNVTGVTFNGNHYDNNMILLALAGASNWQLKQANDQIIVGKVQPWTFRDQYKLVEPEWWNMIDIAEVAPGVKISLKVYAGRLNSRRMQDLPVDPKDSITPELRPLMREYRRLGDEMATLDLFNAVRERIELRIEMSKRYDVDLRSKSDAQIAEAVIKKQLGFYIEKAFWQHGTPFKYKPVHYMRFATTQLQEIYAMVCAATFTTSDKDQTTDEIDEYGNKIKTGIIIPAEIKAARVSIGSSVYKFGIGGLHSMEKGQYHIAQEGVYSLVDRDVRSYYPEIIITLGLYPSQMGPAFTGVYSNIVHERIDAKVNGRYCKNMKDAAEIAGNAEHANYWAAWQQHYKNIDESLKIVINGSFGKFGSKYSILFSPDLLIQTTITGQLALLMLIEALELAGISVVSANTDGIVIRCPDGLEWLRDQIIKDWENTTQFVTEETPYKAIYSRDVNNYMAIGTDGEVKGKGIFAKASIRKSPSNTICVEAVKAWVADGTPVMETIRNCMDVRKFLTIRAVKGGAVKGDVFLGKAVRWYYGINEFGTINYKLNGNRVPRSEGAVPLMDLPEFLPGDIDYNWYVKECYAMISELGIR